MNEPFQHHRLIVCICLSITFVLLSTCTNGNAQSLVESSGATEFRLKLSDDAQAKSWITEGAIYGSECEVAIKNIDGKTALEISSKVEFCDAFLDCKKLFGHPLDITKSRYLSMQLYVPTGSWVGAMKLNFKDGEGNLGGVPEIANNFYRYEDQWLNVEVDLQTMIGKFKTWFGEETSLDSISHLSLNVFNCHQASESRIYVTDIQLSTAARFDTQAYQPMAPPPAKVANIPYLITFDNDALLRRQLGYRAFESSTQAFSKGIAGNETRAIRLKGHPSRKHIAFLPMFDKMTGQPLDLTKVKRFHFWYYVTEESVDFAGSRLFLASEDWAEVLLDENFYKNFKKGEWAKLSVEVEDLDLKQVRGDKEFDRTQVYELRFDLDYHPGKKEIEMWIDDFGWE